MKSGKICEAADKVQRQSSAISAIVEKYAFPFMVNGAKARLGHTYGQVYVEYEKGANVEEDFGTLINGLNELVEKMQVWKDKTEVLNFVSTYSRITSMKIQKLARLPNSEAYVEALKFVPIDKEILSVKKQCVEEVVSEQIATHPGPGATFSITKEMIDAKIAEKMGQMQRLKSLKGK
jgi:hypothetical protein